MAVDSATTIAGFDTAKPAGSDPAAELDNNIRHVKTVIKTDLPNIGGPMTASHTELNYMVGVTSLVQTQLDAKSPIASPTFTGLPAAPTAAVGTNTTQIATMAALQAGLATVAPSTDALALSVSNAAAVTLVAGQQDCATFAGAVTWTLPVAPSVGSRCGFIVGNSRSDNVVARNGQPIMGLAEDMTVDNLNAAFVLRYVNASLGWRLI
ncbi:hypothetical protein [Roseateles sp. P5_E11]